MPSYPYFSCSRIQTFRKCPKSFEFSYVLGVPEAFETIEKYMGSTVHELLEWLFLEKEAGRVHQAGMVCTKFDEIWKGYDIAAARIVKKGLTADDYFRQGLDMAQAYADLNICRETSATLQLEHQFDLDLGDGLIYRGVIDRVSRSFEGVLRLTDYKTGRTVPDPETDLQLRSYALAMFEVYEDERIEICYEDLRQGRSLILMIGRSQIQLIKDELCKAIAEIRSAEHFAATPSNLCSWCGHLPHCSDGEAYRAAMAEADKSNLCPRCGSELKKRVGRFGPFLSCSNFPACRFSRNLS